MNRCLMEYHFGCVDQVWHHDPDGRTAWHGYCGRMTTNADRLCTECKADWHDNYPGYSLPDVLSMEEP